jgi:glycosyltransferase involved in cell wall biosynthesis/SAM-dependent methyltransferase
MKPSRWYRLCRSPVTSLRLLRNRIRGANLLARPRYFVRAVIRRCRFLKRVWRGIRHPVKILHVLRGIFLVKRSDLLGDCLTGDNSTYEPEQFPKIENPHVKLIAYYLPQFHPIPENDRWWGKGFTEWTNVAKAKPLFEGHCQPRLPGELGFYDLRVPETMQRQIQLAKQYGIYGFCFYHYWFGGKRLLAGPVDMFLSHPEWEFPFCLCWANENWTRRWDGQDQEILIAQTHSPEDDLAFIKDLGRYILDPRYIKVEGKPLVIVYRVDILPDAKATAKRWREYCREVGIGEIMLVAAQTFGIDDPRPYGFDAAVAFPPHGTGAPWITPKVPSLVKGFEGMIYYYPGILQCNRPKRTPYIHFKGICCSWDNTPRRGLSASLYAYSTPGCYQEWLEDVVRFTKENNPPEHRFVFVNAWNEWAEGAHLEPDTTWGYAYLNATARVLSRHSNHALQLPSSERPARESQNLVSIVMPAYNHERYIVDALASLKRQKLSGLRVEIVVVDDGSTDATARTVEEFAAANPDLDLRLLRQENAGAHSAINRGIRESSGEYIAVLNSDDQFHPDRIQSLYGALRASGEALCFSDFEVIDDQSNVVGEDNKYVRYLRENVDRIGSYPSLGYALLTFNSAISTGNLFFTRELFEQIGGFSSLCYCHDWDFLISALEFTAPIRVAQKLYRYRLHKTNTFSALGQDVASRESALVLSKAARRMLAVCSVDAYPSLKESKQYLKKLFRKLGHAVERTRSSKVPDQAGKGNPRGQVVVKRAAGFCPVCESDTEFIAADPWLRDHYLCSKCGSKPRQRALLRVLAERLPNWKDLKIHESSPADDYLKTAAPGYSHSHYLGDQNLGQNVRGSRNENLECLTFENQTFDLFITQDVLEHVFNPDKAIREMLRVVRPGGAVIFTVPVHKHLPKTRRRAVHGKTDVVHLQPPEYHGNPVGDGRSLVTWDYGQDFADMVREWCAPQVVQVIDVCERREEFGIDGEYLNVFVVTASPEERDIAA